MLFSWSSCRIWPWMSFFDLALLSFVLTIPQLLFNFRITHFRFKDDMIECSNIYV